MGQVHEVQDRRSGARLAAKSLSRMGPLELYLFKNEFRALADFNHPNLVSLHELFASDDGWYFTMDLVDGQPFLRHVWGDAACASQGAATLITASSPEDTIIEEETLVSGTVETALRGLSTVEDELDGEDEFELEMDSFLDRATEGTADTERHQAVVEEPMRAMALTPDSEARLRPCVAQLVRGIAALHRAGMLHRDLKPSNVLVTSDGQVKLLDFGLVQDLDRGRDAILAARVVGTLPYMAPEQVAGHRLGPAADWYALGVMMYEAMTGRLPHADTGSPAEQAARKRKVVPPHPMDLKADLPRDLAQLCHDLLRIDPEARPGAEEILRRLGLGSAPGASRGAGEASLYVDRPTLSAPLSRALEEVRGGGQVTVHVSGRSGMGKTALVRHLLEGVKASGGLVLDGRCYEKEAVPYKALDPIMDALTRHLASLPEGVQEEVFTPEHAVLTRVFPVMLEAFPWVTGEEGEPDAAEASALELRRQAYASLRDLLGTLCGAGLVVIHIDDMQWSDADSVTFLRELLRSPGAPAALLIMSARSELLDRSQSAAVSRFLSGEDGGRTTSPVRLLEVGPMSAEEGARQAARNMRGPPEEARRIADEAGGVPIFIEELARHMERLSADQPRPDAVSLEAFIGARVHALPPRGPRGARGGRRGGRAGGAAGGLGCRRGQPQGLEGHRGALRREALPHPGARARRPDGVLPRPGPGGRRRRPGAGDGAEDSPGPGQRPGAAWAGRSGADAAPPARGRPPRSRVGARPAGRGERRARAGLRPRRRPVRPLPGPVRW